MGKLSIFDCNVALCLERDLDWLTFIHVYQIVLLFYPTFTSTCGSRTCIGQNYPVFGLTNHLVPKLGTSFRGTLLIYTILDKGSIRRCYSNNIDFVVIFFWWAWIVRPSIQRRRYCKAREQYSSARRGNTGCQVCFGGVDDKTWTTHSFSLAVAVSGLGALTVNHSRPFFNPDLHNDPKGFDWTNGTKKFFHLMGLES